MKFRSAVSLSIAIFTVCNAGLAQEAPSQPRQPSPEQVQQVMQSTLRATMGAMVDIAGPMTEAAMNAQMSIAAKPETAERLATFKRNLFNALTAKGFTQAQALQIVIATNPPAASVPTK